MKIEHLWKSIFKYAEKGYAISYICRIHGIGYGPFRTLMHNHGYHYSGNGGWGYGGKRMPTHKPIKIYG